MFIVGLLLWPSLLSEVLIKAYVSPSLSNVHNFKPCVSPPLKSKYMNWGLRCMLFRYFSVKGEHFTRVGNRKRGLSFLCKKLNLGRCDVMPGPKIMFTFRKSGPAMKRVGLHRFLWQAHWAEQAPRTSFKNWILGADIRYLYNLLSQYHWSYYFRQFFSKHETADIEDESNLSDK